MHVCKLALFLSVLLAAPNKLLFTNALPADVSPRSDSFIVQVLLYKLIECAAASGVDPTRLILTQGICKALTIEPVTILSVLDIAKGWKSTRAVGQGFLPPLTIAKCRVKYYTGLQCVNFIAESEIINSGPGEVPCLETLLSLQSMYDSSNPVNVPGAFSALLECT